MTAQPEPGGSGVVILDGRALAGRREPDIARRAAAVQDARGRAPVLLIVAFADEHGHVPHVTGKIRTAERLGIRAESCSLASGTRTAAAVERMARAVEATSPDAVFVQIPASPDVDEAELLAAIPPALDVDIMTPARADAFLRGAADLPPVTVSGALSLLEAYDIELEGLRGVVVAEDSVYSRMIGEAFRRRGVSMPPPVEADSPRVGEADLAIVALGTPGAVSSHTLRQGCIALDFGYYNAGACGDIDTGPGVSHLRALMPVPGGVGPMTVSALMERVVTFAAS